MGKKRVGDIIVEILQAAGVKHCYGIVGDTLNPITDAIYRSKIEWVHMRHEEAGAFAAGAKALITGKLAACAGSCGPGSLHFINGIYEANRNRAPVVLIASQIVTGQLGMDFPQEVDFKSIYANCSVFCHEILNPEDAQRATALVCQAALARRGVAVLIVPADICAAMAPDALRYRVHYQRPLVRPDDRKLDAVAELLSKGKKTGILAGAGVEGAHDELMKLAQILKAPIAHTSRAKDFVEHDNPYNMGMTGMMGLKSGYHMIDACDTLLLLGTDFAFHQFYPDNAKIIQIDEDGTHLGRRHPVDVGIVGDVKMTLTHLLPRLKPREDSAFLDACLKDRAQTLKILAREEKHADGALIHPQYLVSLINRYADDDALITADGGSPMVWLLRHFHTNGKRRILTSMLHGTMANSMPQALGLKKAFPDRQVISVSGDGGLAMLLGDMLTAVQEKLPIKIVVLNNASLNFVEMEQKVDGLVDNYTNLHNPDFGKLAEVMGYKGWTVTRAEELKNAVKLFLACDGPALLDVRTNSYELVMPPKVRASQVANTALYGVKAVMEGRFKDVKNLLVDNFIR